MILLSSADHPPQAHYAYKKKKKTCYEIIIINLINLKKKFSA